MFKSIRHKIPKWVLLKLKLNLHLFSKDQWLQDKAQTRAFLLLAKHLKVSLPFKCLLIQRIRFKFQPNKQNRFKLRNSNRCQIKNRWIFFTETPICEETISILTWLHQTKGLLKHGSQKLLKLKLRFWKLQEQW